MTLRVVLLKRTTLLHKDKYAADPGIFTPMHGPWVTMGHFDAMYSYLLDTTKKNIFSIIHENNNTIAGKNDGDSYYHPLYLLTEQDDMAFWNQNSWFMAITRIHLASAVTDPCNVKKLREHIFEQCSKVGCSCHVYQTVELSDLTLVVKSNRMSTMLSAILNLWSYPEIGKLYTYCGVDYEHLCNTDLQPAIDDKIDFLSMRFAVRHPGRANAFFRFVKDELGADPIYSVTGVDDAILNFSSLPVRSLVSFFRHWLITGLPKELDFPSIFSDITTRLGTDYREDTLDADNPLEQDPEIAATSLQSGNSLQQLCDNLVKQSRDVLAMTEGKLDSPIDLYWLRNLSELSYSLLRLSRTALLDEFVYLMYSGVKAFLQNLQDILADDNQDRLFMLDKKSCWQFVDNWSHLMEHIMRTERQLAHHPETRPILYDIPLAMLEHTLALLDLCSEILQIQDAPKKQIRYILFPRLCSEIEAEEMFAADSTRPGLLSISIPLHMMYEPQTVQSALCHEISHFIGEHHRNRSMRTECYCQAVAALMADLIFETDHEIFIEQIYHELSIYISSSDTEFRTILDLEAASRDWIDTLLNNNNPNVYCDLIRSVLKKTPTKAIHSRLELRADFINLRYRNSTYFAPYLRIFTTLFREVFADICMLRLLNLKPTTYLKMFFDGMVETPESVEFYAVRTLVALSAVNENIPSRDVFQDTQVICDFFKTIEWHMSPHSVQNTNDGIHHYPHFCIKQLQKYSNKCEADLRALLERDDTVKDMVNELRNMYHNVIDHNMNYDYLQNRINKFRRKCLGKLQ